MRIHRLTIQAFGPFGASETIDFDALGAQGLFLMHGPTGSGKTSVLDAVCFALFGQVPGSRRTHTDRLRSDHAAPHLDPRVQMEFTVAERRLRIDRRPSYFAPKKRGGGTTKRQASVVLEERGATGWRAISTRLDEAGLEISDALGLGLEQFAQVVLLPQGEFAAFLRAKADERAALLERLFDISRFADVERWLADHRRELRGRVDAADASARTALVRAEESLTDHAPQIDHWRSLPLDDLPAQIGAAAADLSLALTAAMAGADRARAWATTTRRRHERAVECRRIAAERADAQLVWQRHLDSADDRAATRRTLQRHDAATRVWPLLGVADSAATELERRSSAVMQAHDRLAALLGSDSEHPLDPEQRLAAGDQALAGVRGLLDVRAQSLQRLPRLKADHVAAARTAKSAAESVAAIVARLSAVDVERAALAEIVAPESAVRDRVRLLRDDRRAGERLRSLTATLATADAEQHARALDFTDAERHVLALRHARLEGMAAELALDLLDGDACPVCGSPDHPAPATDSDPVTAADVDDAEQLAAAADGRLATARAAVAASAARVEEARAEQTRIRADWAMLQSATRDSASRELGMRESAGLESAGLESASNALTDDTSEQRLRSELAALATIEAALGQLQNLAAEADRLGASRDRAQEEHDVALRASERAAQTVADLEATVADQGDRLRAALEAHQRDCRCSDAADQLAAWGSAVLAHHDTFRRLVAEAARAKDATDTAREARDTAENELHRQLEVESFADRVALSTARLPRDEAERKRQELRSAEQVAEHARGVLDRPLTVGATNGAADLSEAITDSDEVDASSVEFLATALESALVAERVAHTNYESIKRAQRSIERLAAEVTAVVESSRADRDRLPTVDRITDLVSGGNENVLRMRLSSYVLAARLEQVTELANESLAVMTGGRYRLEHTDERAKGGSRSGLGLRVLDAWTGTPRDTASLSGGESFMASLALALGLGQAVLHDAGGRPLQTLLVDEGFGTLDDESLELVMQVLDDLRAGGRTVGIVSHVGELRSRVPAQIEVRKSEQGSSLRVHLGDASPAA
ncbi:AAA family ATPase [Calidifontibacter terrae]